MGLESEPTDRFDVAFGNLMLNILDFHSFSMTSLDDPIPGLNETTRFNAADIDKDGDSEVIAFSTETSQESGFMGRVRTFDIDADRVGTLIQDVRLSVSLTIDANRYNFYALDIDGADEPNPIELLLVPPQFIFDFDLPGAEVMVIDADPTTGEFHDTPLPFAMGFITPLGDLNEDGRHDFLWGDENGKPFISYGPSSLASGLSFDNELPPGDDPDFEFKHPPFIRSGTYGDLDNDGIDDAIIGHIENTNKKVGRRFVFGSSGGNLSSEFGLYYRNVFYNTFASSANVGDANGDGFEDFAIVRDEEHQVDIFFGRESLNLAPNVVLQADRSRNEPKEVISGDFNGDGYSDAAVKVFEGLATDVYFGGPDMDGEPDHRFDPASAQTISNPDTEINPANIGDVNDDGIDDFMIPSGSARDEAGNFLNQAWIFYGGSTLNSIPDRTIDFNDDPNLSGNFRRVAPSAAYGDFNGDGVNDLALEMGTIVTDGFVSGGAFLYFGNGMAEPRAGQANTQVSDIDFSAPDLILRPDFLDVVNKTASGVAAGDFDGDGIADLAMGINDLAGDGNESPVIQIFKGGNAMDDAADVELTAPADLFGGELGMFFNSVPGTFEFLPDDDGDGFQNLLMATVGGVNGGTNAVVYAGGTSPDSAPAQVLVAPNPTIGLGGARSVATGDFNNDGNNDIILVQTLDNRDSFRSSRAYLYSPNADNVAVPIEKDEFTGPKSFALSQNYPNPFNPSTTIQFTLPRAANVTLKVYDLLGREVTTLINNEQMTAGTRTVQFDASLLATGMYLYRLEAENFVQIRKMMLIK